MMKTQEKTEKHSHLIFDGKYQMTTTIKCAHEGIFWLVMQNKQGMKDVCADLEKLTVKYIEWVDYRLHPSFKENEEIVNQSVKEWEEFLATEEGQAWLKGDESE